MTPVEVANGVFINVYGLNMDQVSIMLQLIYSDSDRMFWFVLKIFCNYIMTKTGYAIILISITGIKNCNCLCFSLSKCSNTCKPDLQPKWIHTAMKIMPMYRDAATWLPNTSKQLLTTIDLLEYRDIVFFQDL